MIAVIDLGLGNLQSVIRAFERIGSNAVLTRTAIDIQSASALVLPGVGAFPDGMASLERLNLRQIGSDFGRSGRPILGICLGMQLLAEVGLEHGETLGLGLIPGRVERLTPVDPTCRVPHIGWRQVYSTKPDARLIDRRVDGAYFYFAHSYHVVAADSGIIAARFEYGGDVTACIERNNIFGVQFHPEKSQDEGFDLLERFVEIGEGR